MASITPEDAEALANGADLTPQAGILAQYVKDLSFENPNAPGSLQAQGQPKLDISVNVNARAGDNDMYEVELRITANAKGQDASGQETGALFAVELLYAGLFRLVGAPREALEPFLLVEAPRILFPFARRVVADCVRDGGFPPLMLDPIDFGGLYLQQLDARRGGEGEGPFVGNA
jgi:preprotein translocase subunit SecB